MRNIGKAARIEVRYRTYLTIHGKARKENLVNFAFSLVCPISSRLNVVVVRFCSLWNTGQRTEVGRVTREFPFLLLFPASIEFHDLFPLDSQQIGFFDSGKYSHGSRK